MDAFDHSFEAMRAAMDPAGDHVAAVHMWEWHACEEGSSERSTRKKEMDALLGVMANEPGAVYDDYHDEGMSSRAIGAHPQGAIALSCTGIRSDRRIHLFQREDMPKTGLFLKDPTLVLAANSDAFTEYNPRMKGGYELLKMDVGSYVDCAESSVTAERLLALQDIGTYDESAYIDPLDPAVHTRAHVAWRSLMATPPAHKKRESYNELVVNARLDQVQGIIACDPHDETFDLSAPSWTERLDANPGLATVLDQAIVEQKQLAKRMKKHGIDHVPTIAIYQPNAKGMEGRMVHFPPTNRNIALVKHALELSVSERIAQADAPQLDGRGA